MIVAIAQYAPDPFNLSQNIKKLEQIAADAAKKKVSLIVFGETWLSGYPAWLDSCPEVAYWDHEPVKEAYRQLRTNSIAVPSKETDTIGAICKKYKISIIIGINEVVKSGKGQGTVYNSLLFFGRSGELLNHHRKLMPTFTEKLIYGIGDGAGLKIVEQDDFKIGGSICWEHWMPLTRQALHQQGEQIHVAVWPWVHEKHLIASRHYAFEGRCYVLAAGQLLKANQFPPPLTLPENLSSDPDQYVLKGGSCIINPRGEIITEQLFEKEGLIMAEADPDKIILEQMTLDVSGHYNRSDIFDFSFDNKRK
ncbi:MAG: carbon-nitrogen hydrolase family protein [Candidatus Cyclobacteriaceae bacterium M2_1C_046]